MNLSLHDYLKLPPRLTNRERALFAKRLSFLLRSRIDVHEALTILRDESEKKHLRTLFTKLEEDIASGTSLGDAFARFPRTFGTFMIGVVRMGEHIGTLQENLEHLATELTKRDALMRKLRSALIYPLLIGILTILITGLLITFIIPKIVPIFVSLRIDVPLTTRILIEVSHILREYGGTLILVILITSICLMLVRPYAPFITALIHRSLLILPVVNTIVRSYHCALIARTLSLALSSGMHLSRALTVAYESETHTDYAHALKTIHDSVEHGESCSHACRRFPYLFPTLFTAMIDVGERTGNLAESLTYVGELYADDVDEATKNLSNTIEPMLLILMGTLIGLIAVSVITPIYEISKHLYG